MADLLHLGHQVRPFEYPGEGVPASDHELRGGMPHHGSLKVVVNVAVPRHLNAEQRELLEQFEALTTEKNYEPGDGFFDRVKAVFRQ